MTDNNIEQKILVVGPSWIGDMIMAQCLFKVIKQQNPSVQIDVLANNALHPLLGRMLEINKVIPLNIAHGELGLYKRYKLGRQLAAKKYSQAIVLPNSFKSALIPFFAKIPKRTGWRGEYRYGLLNDRRVLNKKKYPLMIEQFIALAFPKNNPLPNNYPYPNFLINETVRKNTLQKFELNTAKKILALCPGAEYGEAKRWPAEYFAKIANAKLDEGWQIWLFGSPKDSTIATTIQTSTNHRCINLVGKTNLEEAIDLLSLANAVITNDSGLMHVAAALNVHLIAIYGSSSPQFTPPLSNKAIIVSNNLKCSPCFSRTCKFGHYKCLKEITPQQILTAIDNESTNN